MRSSKVLRKVTAFVTRDVGPEQKLLVFRHPQAGIQVPAGTVELGEEPKLAVVREVREETNITHVHVVNELGSSTDKLPENEMVLLRMSKLFNGPSFDASSDGIILDRGLNVRLLDSEGEFSFIESEPLDRSQNPSFRHGKKRGYVRSSLLTTKIRRFFFHLTTEDRTPDTWQVQADGHIFELTWSNLDQKVILNTYQQPWLEYYRGQLIE